MSTQNKGKAATVVREKKEQEYAEKFNRDLPKNKKYIRKERFQNQPVRTGEVEHYEDAPESAAVFVERMMCLGFSFLTITEQCELKYHMKPDATRKMVDRIREAWTLFTKLPEDQKKAEMEMQLNNIMRMALEDRDFNSATLCMKRKMELNGMQAQKFIPGTTAGITINQLLGDDVAIARKEALDNVRKK